MKAITLHQPWATLNAAGVTDQAGREITCPDEADKVAIRRAAEARRCD